MPIQHIHELFALDERAFVTEAYRNLLHREPDAHGLAYYLGRLAIGYSKTVVIVQLARSEECRPHDEIKGLKKLLADEQRGGHWFWGWFNRRSRIERALQSGLTALARIEQRLESLHGAILTQAQQLGGLAQQVEQMKNIYEAAHVAHIKAVHTTSQTAQIEAPHEKPRLPTEIECHDTEVLARVRRLLGVNDGLSS